MKVKTTLIVLTLALASCQAMAHGNHSRGHYDSDRNGRYQNDHQRYRNRDYGKNYRQRDYRRDQRYGRDRHYSNPHRSTRINYNRLMRYSPDRFARWYADTAIAQIEQARRYGCRVGKAKGRWRYNWNDHYRHGLKSRRDSSIREVETRDRELSQCNHRGYGYGYGYGG